MKVAIAMRSDALSKRGGDTVQFERTVKSLVALGVDAKLYCGWSEEIALADVLHVTNYDRPNDMLAIISEVRRRKIVIPIVFSTIHHPQDWMEIVTSGASTQEKVVRVVGAPFLRSVRCSSLGSNAAERIRMGRCGFVGVSSARRKLLESASVLIALSEMERLALIQAGVPPDSIAVIHNGVDPFGPGLEWSERSGVAVIGRIERRKNSVRLAETLVRTGLPATFIGRANPNEAHYVKEFDAVVAGAENVNHIGEMEGAKVMEFLQRSRLHVLASEAEVFPLVDLEALACGCQVITTDRSLSASLLSEWATVVSPEDLDADVIEGRYSSRPDPETRRKIPEQFSWAVVAQQLREIYRSAIL